MCVRICAACLLAAGSNTFAEQPVKIRATYPRVSERVEYKTASSDVYLGLVRVSVPYGSHVWSKLLIPINEGKLRGGVGGNYERFDRDAGTSAIFG